MAEIVSYDSFAKADIESAGALEASRGEDDAEVRAYLAEALGKLEQVRAGAGLMCATDDQLTSLLQSCLAEQPAELTLSTEEAASGGLEVKYDAGDLLGWFRSVFTMWRRIVPEPWREPPAEAEHLDAGQVRVAVLGDWGTGLYGAPAVARSIEQDPDGYGVMVHLGDVYYSGTEREVRENFLAHWPRVPGAISRAVNSNHEMYSGGAGLFRHTLPAFGQQATPFALRNDDWLLVGLDTGYAEHDLHGDQVEWLEGLVAAAGERRLVLFSHHQPYSLLDGQGPKLVAKLARLLQRRRVFAWYWGHEHRCVLYDRHPAWGMLGRCVGNGGFPAYRDDLTQYPAEGGDQRWRRLPARNLVPGGVVLDVRNSYPRLAGQRREYGEHGYLSLRFDGPHLTETVHLQDGSPVREREVS